MDMKHHLPPQSNNHYTKTRAGSPKTEVVSNHSTLDSHVAMPKLFLFSVGMDRNFHGIPMVTMVHLTMRHSSAPFCSGRGSRTAQKTDQDAALSDCYPLLPGRKTWRKKWHTTYLFLRIYVKQRLICNKMNFAPRTS